MISDLKRQVFAIPNSVDNFVFIQRKRYRKRWQEPNWKRLRLILTWFRDWDQRWSKRKNWLTQAQQMTVDWKKRLADYWLASHYWAKRSFGLFKKQIHALISLLLNSPTHWGWLISYAIGLQKLLSLLFGFFRNSF